MTAGPEAICIYLGITGHLSAQFALQSVDGVDLGRAHSDAVRFMLIDQALNTNALLDNPSISARVRVVRHQLLDAVGLPEITRRRPTLGLARLSRC